MTTLGKPIGRPYFNAYANRFLMLQYVDKLRTAKTGEINLWLGIFSMLFSVNVKINSSFFYGFFFLLIGKYGSNHAEYHRTERKKFWIWIVSICNLIGPYLEWSLIGQNYRLTRQKIEVKAVSVLYRIWLHQSYYMIHTTWLIPYDSHDISILDFMSKFILVHLDMKSDHFSWVIP